MNVSDFCSVFFILHYIFLYLFSNNELITWYLLHCIANLYIVSMCALPVAHIINDPIYELFNPTEYYDTTYVIIFIHIYHLLFFNCTRDDIFHHLVFVFFGSITVFIFNNGYFTALTHFFICGFPGAIDYALLFLYKTNKISKRMRLKCALYLNVWFRGPGLCFMSLFAIINYIYAKKNIENLLIMILQVFVTMGNGQYYLTEVVYANGKNNI